ncbi:hypothetical protein Aple_101160 [Acrocarpospora pleiomorpha]|uniref:Uncharacterized protein n=2 Tax=Acrocarpospora pleiomorpha TaxID=90975 RepID=A0A5M3Y1X3_9ACTN|nr:hypothetical protein [Acrocarpospora pleiomorpha]GES27216.1 hypothetical protein Aple_101160 [Acrocarpospora pleiomorpha]
MLMGNTPKLEGPTKTTTADPVAEFLRTVRGVLTTAEETIGVEDLEEGLERALAILQRNPEARESFENEIISLIDSPREGVVELVSFVMYELRWTAIQEAVRERMRDPSGNVSNIRLYEAMLDAFSDSWHERDLYRRFA